MFKYIDLDDEGRLTVANVLKAISDKTKIISKNRRLINDFLRENKQDEKINQILQTAKTKILSPSKINTLFTEIRKSLWNHHQRCLTYNKMI